MLTLILVALFPVETFGQMSCGPRVSPRLLQEIPCDMSKAEYCNTPGSSYPWNSVRRYIYENQGLMRRMYVFRFLKLLKNFKLFQGTETNGKA